MVPFLEQTDHSVGIAHSTIKDQNRLISRFEDYLHMSKRDQILEAALGLFIENGFDKTPTSAISKAAGVATGTLFHHFKTKEDLISALYLEIKMELIERIGLALADSNAPEPQNIATDDELKSIFKITWQSVMGWIIQNPNEFLFTAQFGESAYISSSTRERVDEGFAQLQILFNKGQELKLFQPLPVDLLKSLYSSHIFATANYIIENPELWDTEDNQNRLFESAWNLLR